MAIDKKVNEDCNHQGQEICVLNRMQDKECRMGCGRGNRIKQGSKSENEKKKQNNDLQMELILLIFKILKIQKQDQMLI